MDTTVARQQVAGKLPCLMKCLIPLPNCPASDELAQI